MLAKYGGKKPSNKCKKGFVSVTQGVISIMVKLRKNGEV